MSESNWQGYEIMLLPILETRETGDTLLVLYDHMAFPSGSPARNLFAYSMATGKELWRAQDIHQGPTDGYTKIISTTPLVVGNFAGFRCDIDIETGRVLNTAFTK
jgi:hypothetical protein